MEHSPITRHRPPTSTEENGIGHLETIETADSSPAPQLVQLPTRAVTLDAKHVEQGLVALFDNHSLVSDQYDKLAIALIFGSEIRPLKRVLVASAERGDGRTSVVLNLACALASADKRVLVIDCDLRRPSVLRSLGVDAEVGLVETLVDDLPLIESLITILPSGFQVLPSLEPVGNPTRVLTMPSFREILTTLDQFYDFILFDAPPLADAGAHYMVHLTDTTILVIRAGRTTSAQLAKAIEPLKVESLFGVVLNRASQC